MAARSDIVLASASPRRRELLAGAGIACVVIPSSIPEEPLPGEPPEVFAERLAREKAVEVAASHPGRFFIAADTVVVCDGEIMGKPADAADAERMLKKLSGIGHDVITGYAVYDRERNGFLSDAVRTRVFFRQLREGEIADYIATGCPFDKAGGYAIQGGAAYMVRRIEGSYTNVVGLPLCEVVEALCTMGALQGHGSCR